MTAALIGNFQPSFNTKENGPMPPADTADNGCGRPMLMELNRLNTFRDWPVPFIEGKEFAKAGLFYTKLDDVVQCAFCGVELGKWERGDDPMLDHRKWASYCPFVRGRPCGNIPMSENQTDRADEGQDTCGKYGIEIRQYSYPENDEPALSKLNIQTKSAVYKNYALREARLHSFVDWPVGIKQKPDELSEAGFYYTGKGDQTVCFYCGVGLKNWEESDVPWEQHAIWYPKCGYLLMKKSSDYVKLICDKNKAVLEKQVDSVPNKPSSSTASKPEAANDDDKTKDPSSDDRQTLCKICYSKEVGIVFLPCGHMIACVDCAATQTKCSICRHDLEATVRAFLS